MTTDAAHMFLFLCLKHVIDPPFNQRRQRAPLWILSAHDEKVQCSRLVLNLKKKYFWQGQRGPSVNFKQGKDKTCQMEVANLSITGSLYWKYNQRLWKLASLWHMLMLGGFKAIWLGWESYQWLCSLLKAWTVWWKGLLSPQMGPLSLCRDWNRIWHCSACYQMFQAWDSLPLEALQFEDASEEHPLCQL